MRQLINKKILFFYALQNFNLFITIFLFQPLNQGIYMDRVPTSSPGGTPPFSYDVHCKEWTVPDSVNNPLPKTEEVTKSFFIKDIGQLFLFPVIPALAQRAINIVLPGMTGGSIYAIFFAGAAIDLGLGMISRLTECVDEHEKNNKEQREIIKNQVLEHNNIVSVLKAELSRLTEQINILSKENLILIDSNKTLKNQIAELDEKLKQLSITNLDLKETEGNLKYQVSGLTEENFRLTTTLDEFQNVEKHIKVSVEALHALKDQQKILIEEMNKLREEDENRKEKSRKELQESIILSTNLKNHNEQLEKDIAERKVQHRELQESIEELRKTQGGYKTMLEGYQATLSQFTNAVRGAWV